MNESTGPVVGLMVGTSLDGIDAVLVGFSATAASVIAFETVDFHEVDPARLRELASGAATTAAELSALAGALARDHARAVAVVDPGRGARLLGAHGVTIAHAPGASRGHGWQVLDGAALAALTGRDVACDFRRADIALGGEGAPLAPLADLALRGSAEEDRVILNLGGISNFTALPAGARHTGELVAGDAGPANLVLDGWMRRCSGGQRQFDENGALASGGKADAAVARTMLADPWFSRPFPRSAGREEFGEPWLDRFLALGPPGAADADRMATLVEIVVGAIVRCLDALPGTWRRTPGARVLVTGGGRHNRAVMGRLEQLLPSFTVEPIEAIGENGDAKEAVDFAWLAVQRIQGLPLDLAPVTGAKQNVVAGALYAGAKGSG